MSIANNDEINLKEIGETIKNARRAENMSREKAAELIGISKEYLTALENGKGKTPSLRVFVKLFKTYRLSADSIIYDDSYISRESKSTAKRKVYDLLDTLNEKQTGNVSTYIINLKEYDATKEEGNEGAGGDEGD